MGNMRDYVALLNALAEHGTVDLNKIEDFWIARVQEFFAGKPFQIRLDASRSLRVVVRHILEQAVARQREMPGVQYAGAVMPCRGCRDRALPIGSSRQSCGGERRER
jgi:hypothetical protein